MKVLKAGKWPLNEKMYKCKCPKCKSLLECSKKDIIYEQRHGDYVTCPICGFYIDWDYCMNWEHNHDHYCEHPWD